MSIIWALVTRRELAVGRRGIARGAKANKQEIARLSLSMADC